MSKMIEMYRVLAKVRKYENDPNYKGFELGLVSTENEAKELCSRHMNHVGDPEGHQYYATYEKVQIPSKKSDMMEYLEREFADDLRELEEMLPF